MVEDCDSPHKLKHAFDGMSCAPQEVGEFDVDDVADEADGHDGDINKEKETDPAVDDGPKVAASKINVDFLREGPKVMMFLQLVARAFRNREKIIVFTQSESTLKLLQMVSIPLFRDMHYVN